MSETDQATSLLVAFEGATLAVNWRFCPTSIWEEAGVTVTPLTGTFPGFPGFSPPLLSLYTRT
ncbi:hypothetical protein D3C81_2084570 [compost metagenome]